jgi:hypothetical protein
MQRMQRGQGLAAIRGPETTLDGLDKAAISLSVEDLYLTSEPISMGAYLQDANPECDGLIAEITNITGKGTAQSIAFQQQEDAWVVELGGLPTGVYQITVRTVGGPLDDAPPPVQDIFEVVP